MVCFGGVLKDSGVFGGDGKCIQVNENLTEPMLAALLLVVFCLINIKRELQLLTNARERRSSAEEPVFIYAGYNYAAFSAGFRD